MTVRKIPVVFSSETMIIRGSNQITWEMNHMNFNYSHSVLNFNRIPKTGEVENFTTTKIPHPAPFITRSDLTTKYCQGV